MTRVSCIASKSHCRLLPMPPKAGKNLLKIIRCHQPLPNPLPTKKSEKHLLLATQTTETGNRRGPGTFLVRPPGFEFPDHRIDGLPGRWLGRPLDALGYVLDQARLRPHRPDRLTVGSSILRFTTQRTLTDRKCLDTRLKAAKFKSCHHIPDREFNCQTHLQILREVTGWPRVLYCLSVLRTGRSQMVEAFARKY